MSLILYSKLKARLYQLLWILVAMPQFFRARLIHSFHNFYSKKETKSVFLVYFKQCKILKSFPVFMFERVQRYQLLRIQVAMDTICYGYQLLWILKSAKRKVRTIFICDRVKLKDLIKHCIIQVHFLITTKNQLSK